MIGKKQLINNTSITGSQVVLAGRDVNINIDADILEKLTNASKNIPLLNRLVSEKIELCKQHILFVNEAEARKLIETFFTFGVQGLLHESSQQLYFLRYLLLRFENKLSEAGDCIEFLDEGFCDEIETINAVLENDGDISRLHTLRSESQAYVLNQLFAKGRYDVITSEYDNLTLVEEKLRITWDYYSGISYFNLHLFEQAINHLEKVFPITKNPMHQMVALISKMQYLFVLNNSKNVCEELRLTFDELENLLIREPGAEYGNENLVLGTELQYYFSFNLGKFEEKYHNLTDKEKSTVDAKYFWALYCERNGNFELALDQYKNIENSDKNDVQFHMMFCNLMLQNWKEVISIYNLIPAEYIEPQHRGIMLQALFHCSRDEYRTQLDKNVKLCSDDIDSMYFLALATEESIEDFDEFIFPILQKNKTKIISNSNIQMKFGYASMLFHAHHGKFCVEVLKSIDDFDVIGNEPIQILCSELYEDHCVEPDKIENIADLFIEQDKEKISFMRLKCNALNDQKKYLSAIKISKELFDLTNELDDACNVVALALNNDPNNMRDYMQYVQLLMKSKVPRHLLAVAAANVQLGKIDEADRYGYYAMMHLDNKDDFEIFSGYVGLDLNSVYEHNNKEVEHEIVKENSAVSLQRDGERITFCLEDMNDDLNLENSHACGAEHIYYTDSGYFQLLDKHVGDRVVLGEKEYIVSSIIDKYVYAFRYALDKLTNNPQKASFPFIAMKSSSVNEMIEQIKTMIPWNNRMNGFEMYYHNDSPIGIPIEWICNGNYDEYIEVVRTLLFGENQTLYAGASTFIPDMEKYSYVVTVSTLVVMSMFNALDLLDRIKDRIIIPESTVMFLKNCVDNQKKMQVVSPGKMITLSDGRFTIIPPDKTVKDTWKSILKICTRFKISKVSNDEIIGFDVVPGLSIEMLSSSLKLEKCQIDSYILAKRENAIYISDDMFYRTLADLLQIKNGNMTCLMSGENGCYMEKSPELVGTMKRSNYVSHRR